jgi:hypothetical protein
MSEAISLHVDQAACEIGNIYYNCIAVERRLLNTPQLLCTCVNSFIPTISLLLPYFTVLFEMEVSMSSKHAHFSDGRVCNF